MNVVNHCVCDLLHVDVNKKTFYLLVFELKQGVHYHLTEALSSLCSCILSLFDSRSVLLFWQGHIYKKKAF